jgi:hypothetical protein
MRFSELWRTAENTSLLTTDQKIAGSSPAERARKSPVFAGLLALPQGSDRLMHTTCLPLMNLVPSTQVSRTAIISGNEEYGLLHALVSRRA